ncbi:DUF1294 domain-containing protein [Flavobacterium sp. NST-5]|uniref:DUF1294 domain-containing protein n=1 Tax=Flavobacterium ichthyis TaxID=2698827 RepID=A0ABW9ZAQ0_9FLAO|nr:DUF1294 domain-containing protein [Flavobacterium ichthyis]NBL65769.1 DUF1294 domain-containing protein [Flavobacterium ichthyis]
MNILLYLFIAVNFIAFGIIGYDKWLARNNKRRIPEKILLGLVLIGGTIGSGFGMLIFRHKTSKRSYLLKFFLIVVLQVSVLYACVNYSSNLREVFCNPEACEQKAFKNPRK